MHVAKSLTFPERVTEHNIARLRQNVLNGVHACIEMTTASPRSQ